MRRWLACYIGSLIVFALWVDGRHRAAQVAAIIVFFEQV